MPDVELPAPAPDGCIYLTTDQAAAVAHVSKSTISSWKADGLLVPHPASPPRHPLYDREDVLTVEKRQRDKLRAAGHDYWAQRRPGLRGKRKDVA